LPAALLHELRGAAWLRCGAANSLAQCVQNFAAKYVVHFVVKFAVNCVALFSMPPLSVLS
jgi:hypothetical protein